LGSGLLGEKSTKEEAPKPTRSEISRIMSAMGRKGGKKSAVARMEKIPEATRREIALKAAKARWGKKKVD
jgi:hypothetical protein